MNSYMNLDQWRIDAEAALAEVNKKYGVTTEIGRITYGNKDFTAKMTVTRTDIDVEKDNFLEALHYMNDFTADDFRRKVTIKGVEYEITGLKPYNKYNVLVRRCRDGHAFGFNHVAILAALGRKNAAAGR